MSLGSGTDNRNFPPKGLANWEHKGVDHMRKYLFIIGLIVAMSMAAFGQKNNKNGGNAPTLSADSSVQAALQSSIDAKSAKVGDQVVLKTTQAIKQNGQTVVAKGSKLVGHITEVARRTKQNNESRIGMVFDRLQGGDLSMPITATITSITQARASASSDDFGSADVMGSSSSSGRVSSGGGNSGGGLLGGGGGGLLGGATSTVGNIVNTSTNVVGNVANTTTGAVGNTTQNLGGALSGIRLSSSTSASASGSTTLSSNNRDIKLEQGVTFSLLVSGSVDK